MFDGLRRSARMRRTSPGQDSKNYTWRINDSRRWNYCHKETVTISNKSTSSRARSVKRQFLEMQMKEKA